MSIGLSQIAKDIKLISFQQFTKRCKEKKKSWTIVVQIAATTNTIMEKHLETIPITVGTTIKNAD